MKKVAILGSTGSIGRNALEVLSAFPADFELIGLAAHTNIGLLRKQIEKHRPKKVVITDENSYQKFLDFTLESKTEVLFGHEGLKKLVTDTDVDLVINALVGSVGLIPTIETLRAGKTLAMANKEVLVMAGKLITQIVKENDCQILPIDSEHSAILQCLSAGKKEEIKRLILTASGGPFYERPLEEFDQITVKEALSHPTWDMGKKITVDSATLMNKGLEVIEAHFLFDMPIEKIKVLIHPQSVVHSMVEFVDGSVVAQMGVPDMRLPIQYALFYPDRMATSNGKFLDLAQINDLSFSEPNLTKFPCLKLAFFALKSGGTAPAVLNSANEVAVESFLRGRIDFVNIPGLVRSVLSLHQPIQNPSLEDIISADSWAREESKIRVKKFRVC